jgi:hypothetical protein
MCHPCPHPSLSPSMRCVGCLLAPINATSRSESPHVVVGCGFQTRRAHQLADRSPRLCLLCARVDEVNAQKLLHLRDDAGRPEPRRGRLFSEMGGTDGSIASIDGFDRKDWLVSVQLGWGGGPVPEAFLFFWVVTRSGWDVRYLLLVVSLPAC